MGRCRWWCYSLSSWGPQLCCLLSKASLYLLVHSILLRFFHRDYLLYRNNDMRHRSQFLIARHADLVALSTAQCVVFGAVLVIVRSSGLLRFLRPLATWLTPVSVLSDVSFSRLLSCGLPSRQSLHSCSSSRYRLLDVVSILSLVANVKSWALHVA